MRSRAMKRTRWTPTFRALAALASAGALAPAPVRAGSAAAAPIALSRPASFDEAVSAVERATGAKGEVAELGGAAVPLADARAFEVDGGTAERLLAGSHRTFRDAGLYLFRLERAFGIAGEKDPVILLRAADRSAVVRRVGTSGAKAGATTEKIVAWLDALAKDEPFDLTEIGVDYLAGRFARAPSDPAAIARRCVELAPDLVAARASTLALLVEEIRTARTLYLIW
ncbi:MAG TPA: DUF4253 domain-containing protein [Anaeromyxobacter sp.]|nr:DUF4253 domain-containing protein [Anaeromyxobacter sp.]